MKRKKRGIRLIYLILIFILLITPTLFATYKISTFPVDHEALKKEETVRDILNMQEEYQKLEVLSTNLVDNINEIEPHIDDVTNTKYITYEDIGIAEAAEDSYEIMKKTHNIANQYGYEVRATLKEYHIYRLNSTEPIYIQTNTDWNGANIIIHDEQIKKYDSKNTEIFRIISDKKSTQITDINIIRNIELNIETKKIEELSGYGKCLCIAYNEEKKQYIRSGSNKNSGSSQVDIFRINNEGELLNQVKWNFEKITKIILIPIPENTITVQNGNFTTIIDEDKEETTTYLKRNIKCSRSATVLKNINHNIDNKDSVGGPYFGFIVISYATQVELSDCNLTAHKYKKASSYDLILEFTTDILLNNVNCNTIEENDRWGITGTNYTKDITYKNCTLNRIDAHCGVYNLTIDNCTVGVKGITLTGGGNLKITNTTKIGGSSFIELRSDYGSTWNGNIQIENCKYDMKQQNKLISFKVMYDSDGKVHDYGYERVLPNIYIYNLEIQNSNEKDNKIYVFYNDQYYTGNETGNLVDAGYTLPKEIVIDNYSISSGKAIKAFYQENDGLKNVNININIPNRPKLSIKDENGTEYISGNLTNKTIYLKLDTTSNIENELQINGQVIKEKSATIENSGIYNTIVTSIDNAGNIKKDEYVINIDKNPPIINGIENNAIYDNEVTPIVGDNDVTEVYLYKNNNLLQNYKLNSKITEEGKYKLEVMDKAGNVTTMNFEVKNKENIENIKQYTVKESYIKDVLPNTTNKTFFENSTLSTKLKVYHDNKEILETDIIKTGDTLCINDEKYTLIVNGDVSGDGKVSIVDIMQVKRHITSNDKMSDIKKQAADVNKDEKIDIKDVMKMVRITFEN